MRVLNSDSCTLEELLLQDEFIQETQGRNARLLSLLASPSGTHTLLYYLTTPQHPSSQAHAFRYPFMACEAFRCKVDELLDAVVGAGREGQAGRDDGLLTLFSPACPALLRQRSSAYGREQDRSQEVPPGTPDPFQLSQGPHAPPTGPRAYLTGYWGTVVRVLCQARPGPLMRFLDSTPGIGQGLVALLGSDAGASTLTCILGLPWARPCALLCSPAMCLAEGEEEGQGGSSAAGLPAMLLGTLSAGLQACSAPAPSDAEHALRLAEGAVAVLSHALTAARSSAPHAKFGDEDYMEGCREASDAAAAAAGAAAGAAAAPPPTAAALLQQHTFIPSPELRAALTPGSMALSPAYFAPSPPAPSIALRLLQQLRDGPGAAHLCALASQALQLCASLPASRPAQRLCATVLTLLTRVLVATHRGLWMAVLEGSTREGCGSGSGSGSEGVPGASPASPPALLHSLVAAAAAQPPSLLSALCAALGSLTAAASAASAAAGRAAAPHPSSPAAAPLGLHGVHIASALAAALACAWPATATACAAARAFPALLAAQQAFPWHSVLHGAVAAAVCSLLYRSCSLQEEGAGGAAAGAAAGAASPLLASAQAACHTLQAALLLQADFPSHASSALALPSNSIGYAGHVQAACNALLGALQSGALSAQCEAALRGHAAFWACVDGPLAVANVRNGAMIGGRLAPDVKASGVVGAAADAAAAAPKKKGGEAGGGGPGSAASADEADGIGVFDKRQQAQAQAQAPGAAAAAASQPLSQLTGEYQGSDDEEEAAEEEARRRRIGEFVGSDDEEEQQLHQQGGGEEEEEEEEGWSGLMGNSSSSSSSSAAGSAAAFASLAEEGESAAEEGSAFDFDFDAPGPALAAGEGASSAAAPATGSATDAEAISWDNF